MNEKKVIYIYCTVYVQEKNKADIKWNKETRKNGRKSSAATRQIGRRAPEWFWYNRCRNSHHRCAVSKKRKERDRARGKRFKLVGQGPVVVDGTAIMASPSCSLPLQPLLLLLLLLYSSSRPTVTIMVAPTLPYHSIRPCNRAKSSRHIVALILFKYI